MIKFLVIRFSSIGDIVLTTPVVRILKKHFPNSEIHFLTKKQFSFLLKDNPYVDKVIELKEGLKETIQLLEGESYDHLIDLHNNIRTRRIKSALSIPEFTVDKLNWKKWLLVNFKINKMPQKHIVERYLDTLSVFDIANDEKPLDYFIPQKDHYQFEKTEFDISKGFIAFVMGATYFTKQIPSQLAIQIMNQTALPFVLLGGKDDVDKSNEVAAALEVPYLNLCGEINLNQSASIIKQSKLVVSSDTGLMHIAAAFKKPIVSIWGNTVPEFGMGPYLPHNESRIFEKENLKCRPCSKIGFNKCPKKHFDCMLQINPSEVSEYIKSIF